MVTEQEAQSHGDFKGMNSTKGEPPLKISSQSNYLQKAPLQNSSTMNSDTSL